jgi:hypothetical protein
MNSVLASGQPLLDPTVEAHFPNCADVQVEASGPVRKSISIKAPTGGSVLGVAPVTDLMVNPLKTASTSFVKDVTVASSSPKYVPSPGFVVSPIRFGSLKAMESPARKLCPSLRKNLHDVT